MLFTTIEQTEIMIEKYSRSGIEGLGSVILNLKEGETSTEVIMDRQIFAESLTKQIVIYNNMLGTLGVCYRKD
jgi:hypothetical protein